MSALLFAFFSPRFSIQGFCGEYNCNTRAGIETTGGTLTINGTGSVVSTGGTGAGLAGDPALGGAGIGGGDGGNGGTIIINGGNIVAHAPGSGGAGIGGGNLAIGGTIIINGGNITASGSSHGSGIGSGGGLSLGQETGNIIINGGTITASSPFAGAGIGGSGIGSVTIAGGNIEANGGNQGAGIGSCLLGGPRYITISGGIVRPTGGGVLGLAAAIGGSHGMSGSYLTIIGGVVEIISGQWIGGGSNATNHGTLNVNGGNLSIHDPYELRGGALHIGQDAFRVEIFLDHNGSKIPFGNHVSVTYTIGGLTINAITDSQGRLFMYLPIYATSSLGRMVFGDYIYTEFLFMNSDHGNILILTLGDTILPRPPSDPGALWLQTGANSNQGMWVTIEAMDAITLGLRDNHGNNLINVIHESGEDISPLVNMLDAAKLHVTNERANLGAKQYRLEYTARSLAISSENLQDAESRIRNTDIAREMMDFTQMNILFQSGTAMLAHANQLPNNILQLLQQ